MHADGYPGGIRIASVVDLTPPDIACPDDCGRAVAHDWVGPCVPCLRRRAVGHRRWVCPKCGAHKGRVYELAPHRGRICHGCGERQRRENDAENQAAVYPEGAPE